MAKPDIFEETIATYQYISPIPRKNGGQPQTDPKIRHLVAFRLFELSGRHKSTREQMDGDDDRADFIIGIAPQGFIKAAERRLAEKTRKAT